MTGPGFRFSFGPPEFDAAVHRIVDRLTTHPDTERAWSELLAALPLWRPVSPDHLAPVSLLAEPALSELITPARARTLLTHPRS
ncbi:hypothetical protein [Kitasatospora phosalacinea]|uniref:hypothetical protein n=1 Tax=Kitasatospora phosalacinea TaxID=2065 RepID=UPI0005272B15|nr:hypothetical protein [Kitasatospora phosalacinea]